MNEVEFFEGHRVVDSYSLALHGGKARLRCLVREHWDQTISRSISCGKSAKFKAKKTLGVTTVDLEELEGSVKASFGLKGLSQFKSEIKAKNAREVHFEEAHEEEDEFVYKAPPCGRTTLLVYQLQRLHRFSYQDNRFKLWRKESFIKEVAEWTNNIWERTKEIKNDPGCNCSEIPDDGIDGPIVLKVGSIGMTLGYKKIDHGLNFPRLNMSFPNTNIEDILFTNFTFPRTAIPSYLLFMANEYAENLTGYFLPHQEEAIATSVPEEFMLSGQNLEDRRQSYTKISGYSIGSVALALLAGGIIGAGTIKLLAAKSEAETRKIQPEVERGVKYLGTKRVTGELQERSEV